MGLERKVEKKLYLDDPQHSVQLDRLKNSLDYIGIQSRELEPRSGFPQPCRSWDLTVVAAFLYINTVLAHQPGALAFIMTRCRLCRTSDTL